MTDPPLAALSARGPVQGRCSFLIHRINAHLARLCSPMFRRWHVDIDLARLLAVLDQEGSMAVGDIARVIALPASTIAHQLSRLEALGYIIRAPDGSDSRVVMVSLSGSGEAVARECNTLSREVNDVLVAALAELKESELAEALARIDSRLAALSTIDLWP